MTDGEDSDKRGHWIESNSGPSAWCPGPDIETMAQFRAVEPLAWLMHCPRCGASYRMPDAPDAPSGGTAGEPPWPPNSAQLRWARRP